MVVTIGTQWMHHGVTDAKYEFCSSHIWSHSPPTMIRLHTIAHMVASGVINYTCFRLMGYVVTSYIHASGPVSPLMTTIGLGIMSFMVSIGGGIISVMICRHKECRAYREVIHQLMDKFILFPIRCIFDIPVRMPNGDLQWGAHGLYYRRGDEPTLIRADGVQEWLWGQGRYYRKSGNYTYFDPTRNRVSWYDGTQLHRDDGPAVIEGNNYEYYSRGRLHRIHEPASEWEGRMEWWMNGVMTRDDIELPSLIVVQSGILGYTDRQGNIYIPRPKKL